MEYIEIDINEKIHFTRKTKKYGVAYFEFCFEINKEGKIEKVFITPSQQPNKKHGWVIEAGVSTGYAIEVGKNIQLHPIWYNIHGFYCEEHNSMRINVATPENTSILSCDHIGENIWFKFE